METRLFSITGEIRSEKAQKGRKTRLGVLFRECREEGTRQNRCLWKSWNEGNIANGIRRRGKQALWDRKEGKLAWGQLKQMLLKSWKLRIECDRAYLHRQIIENVSLILICTMHMYQYETRENTIQMTLSRGQWTVTLGWGKTTGREKSHISFPPLSPFDHLATAEASAPPTGGDGMARRGRGGGMARR